MVGRGGSALVAFMLCTAACDSNEEDAISRQACGHQAAYDGDLDGYYATIRVVDDPNHDQYTIDIYIALPDGGGVSSATVPMQQCGEIEATVKGSAGTYEVVALLTEDSASGAWTSEALGRSGDWVAEVDR